MITAKPQNFSAYANNNEPFCRTTAESPFVLGNKNTLWLVFINHKSMRTNDVTVLLLITLSLSASHSKTFEYRLIQANNIQRQELLQQKCDKYDLGNNELYQNNSIHTLSEPDLEHLLIDRKHKFLYCYVPKVSFVYWSREFSFRNQSLSICLPTHHSSRHSITNIGRSFDGIIFKCPENVRWIFLFSFR